MRSDLIEARTAYFEGPQEGVACGGGLWVHALYWLIYFSTLLVQSFIDFDFLKKAGLVSLWTIL